MGILTPLSDLTLVNVWTSKLSGVIENSKGQMYAASELSKPSDAKRWVSVQREVAGNEHNNAR